jgi:hypothetical protein
MWTGRKEFSVFLIKVSYKDLSSSRSLSLSLSLKLQLHIFSSFEGGGGVLCACGPVYVGGLPIEKVRKHVKTRKE